MFRGLHTAINGLTLGNGTVYNFIDYIGQMHITGGIKNYTAMGGYFNDNVMRNYSEGLEGRYGYGVSDETGKLYGSDGKVLEGGNIVDAYTPSEKIGDLYGVDGTASNAGRDFMKIETFSALGDEFRWRNAINNVDESDYRERYADFEADEKFTAEGVEYNQLGDEYSTHPKGNESIRSLYSAKLDLARSSTEYLIGSIINTRTVSDSVGYTSEDGEHLSDVLQKISDVENVDVYYGDITPRIPRKGNKKRKSVVFNTDFGKDILDIAKKVRERYSPYNRGSAAVNASPHSRRELYGENEYGKDVPYASHSYGDLYNLRNDLSSLKTSSINMPAAGLIEYYEDEIWRHSELKQRYRGYRHAYPYAFDSDDSNVPYYTGVPDVGKVFDYNDRSRWSPANHTVNREYKADSFRGKTNGERGIPRSTIYQYYQEYEGGAVRSMTPDGVTDGTSAFIGSFGGDKETIMKKVNRKFADDTIKSLINRFHTDYKDDLVSDELVSSYSQFGLSRGRNLLKRDTSNSKKTGFDNPYCRVWTAHHQYSKMRDRIRPFVGENGDFITIAEVQEKLGPLRPNNGATRLSDWSVLEDSGFVKITPYNESGDIVGGTDSLKKYMFSIENLAWKGFAGENDMMLTTEQRGPNQGRIMWFPPYNLKFTENVNTSWRDNEFIGRGEKIYTYANTERGGTLSFTLLIDHPSYLNKWRGTSEQVADKESKEQEILRFFAGCELPDVTEPELPKEEMNFDFQDEEDVTPVYKPTEEFIEKKYVMFFPNNFSAQQYMNNPAKAVELISKYECGPAEPFTEMDRQYESQKLAPQNYDNRSLYSLNDTGAYTYKEEIDKLLNIGTDFKSFTELKSLTSQFTNGKVFGMSADDYELAEILVDGFASRDGYVKLNMDLARDRANTIANIATYLCKSIDPNIIRTGRTDEIDTWVDGHEQDVNYINAKIGRSAVITFRVKLKFDSSPVRTGNTVNVALTQTEAYRDMTLPMRDMQEYLRREYFNYTITANTIDVPNVNTDENQYVYGNEYLYFKKIKSTDQLVYKNIVDKVKFFNPAYHSLTPEGFNARLVFLHQCTRQGPTIGSHSGVDKEDMAQNDSKYIKSAANLAFGRPPICVLRIGDFYHSKILITSLSIDYDNGGGTTWDLNPEGVGVQPMMANININFNFIGGQDIDGPVNSLQNAITYNYYANSSIYTDLSDAYNSKISNEK